MDGKIFVPEHSKNEDGSLTAEGELFSYVNSCTGRSYDLIEYVNDTNREYTEVLMEYGINADSRTAYTYGESPSLRSADGSVNQRLSSNRIWKPNDVQTSDRMQYYSYDGRGSVTGMTSRIGLTLEVYQYDPYGQMTHGEPLQKNLYAYNGESYNPNTGLEYLRARYYNAGTGRFFQEDTYLGDITDPLTLNRYAYVKNSPLNYVDPSGHTAIEMLDKGKELYWNISRLDGPSPGVADALGLLAWGGAAIIAGGMIVGGLISQAKAAGKTEGCETDTQKENSEDEKTRGDSETEKPKYPGNDPDASPGEGWTWRGPADKGAWYNPKTGESMRPDLNHPDPIGPHWDYKNPDGVWHRLNPDGTLIPKK